MKQAFVIHFFRYDILLHAVTEAVWALVSVPNTQYRAVFYNELLLSNSWKSSSMRMITENDKNDMNVYEVYYLVYEVRVDYIE